MKTAYVHTNETKPRCIDDTHEYQNAETNQAIAMVGAFLCGRHATPEQVTLATASFTQHYMPDELNQLVSHSP